MQSLWSTPNSSHCAANELHYNLGFRAIDFQLHAWCQKRGIPIIAYSPLGQGSLVHNPILEDMAQRYKASAAQIALAWVLSHPDLIAIPKAGSLEHIRENALAEQIQLSQEDLQKLESAFPKPTRHQPITTW